MIFYYVILLFQPPIHQSLAQSHYGTRETATYGTHGGVGARTDRTDNATYGTLGGPRDNATYGTLGSRDNATYGTLGSRDNATYGTMGRDRLLWVWLCNAINDY